MTGRTLKRVGPGKRNHAPAAARGLPAFGPVRISAIDLKIHVCSIGAAGPVD
jgi:hypothetical protein